MKRKVLIRLLTALFLFCTGEVWADTDKLVPEVGWQKLTTALPDNPTDYYYMFVVNDTKTNVADIALRAVAEANPRFDIFTKPTHSFLWEVKAGTESGKYAIASPITGKYLHAASGGCWDTNLTGTSIDQYTDFEFVFTDGTCTIQNISDAANFDTGGRYIGLWKPEEGYFGPEQNGNSAGNKSPAEAEHFYVYAIAKSAAGCDDITSTKVQNAGFSSKDNWTCSSKISVKSSNDGGQTYNCPMLQIWATGSKNTAWIGDNGKDATIDANTYIQQDVTLPAGIYCLSARVVSEKLVSTLSVAGQSVTISDKTDIIPFIEFELAEQTSVTIKYSTEGERVNWSGHDKNSAGDPLWFAIDEVWLYSLADLLPSYKTQLQQAIDAATTTNNSHAHGDGDILAAAIVTAQGVHDNASSTNEDYLAAMADLEAAVAYHAEVQDAMGKLQVAIANARGEREDSSVDDGGTLSGLITQAQSMYGTNATPSVIYSMIAQLGEAAWNLAAGGQMPSAGYKGTVPVAGQDYYLLNVYQSKLLSYGNAWDTQVSLYNNNPLRCTLEEGETGYKINTHYNYSTSAWDASADNYIYIANDTWISNAPVVNATYGTNADQIRTPQEWTIAPTNYGYTISCDAGYLMFDNGTACTVGETSNATKTDCAQWLFIPVDEYEAMQAKKAFTTCALNVDGMPREINLVVKKIELNPDAKEEDGAKAIGAKVRELGYDVIGLSEDFNYHDNLMSTLNAGSTLYTAGSHRENIKVTGADLSGVNLSNLESSTKPLFDTDGLGFLTRDAKASFSNESWTAWNDHNGWAQSGADGLIKKGWRYYTVTIDGGTANGGTEIDLYILHMDAETNLGDNLARVSQMHQLADAIIATSNRRPIIVMGDTNCRYTRDPLQTDFIGRINADPRFMCKDAWVERCRGGVYPGQNGESSMVGDVGYRLGEVVDKVFYINNLESNIRIQPEQFRQDISFINEAGEPLADHWPMVVDFSYREYDPEIDDVPSDGEVVAENVYLRNKATGNYLNQGHSWDTYVVTATYGIPVSLKKMGEGKYKLDNPAGIVGTNGFVDDTDNPNIWTMTELDNGSCIFSYRENGEKKALAADGDYTYNYGSQQYHQPTIRTARTDKAYDENDTYQQWEIVTKEQLLEEAKAATSSSPKDLTFMLPGANFNRRDGQSGAWQQDISHPSRARSNFNGGHAGWLDATSNYIGEMFLPGQDNTDATTWDVYQELTDMPEGDYVLTCQACYRVNSGSATIKFYGNSAETAVTHTASPDGMAGAGRDFFAGNYGVTLNATVGTDGKLRIGIKKTSGTASGQEIWTCFDNFQIWYKGCASAYATAWSAADAQRNSGSRAITSALTEYPHATEAAVNGAYPIGVATEVLRNAVTMANASDKATSLLQNPNFTEGTTRGVVYGGSEGSVEIPNGWEFEYQLEGWNDCGVVDNDGQRVFNMYGATIKHSHLYQTVDNLPNGLYKVSAEFKTWKGEFLEGAGSHTTDGQSWIGLYAQPDGGDTGRSDNVDGNVSGFGATDGQFHTYTAYAKVENHKLTIGVLNNMTRFYMVNNVQLDMVDEAATENKAELAKSLIYEELTEIHQHGAEAGELLEIDLTDSKFNDASNVDIATGAFIQQPNAIVRTSKAGLVNKATNVVVNGVCENLVITDKAPFQNSAAFTANNATYERAMLNTWGTVMLPYDVISDDDVQYYTLSSVTTGEDGVMRFTAADILPAGTPGVFVKKATEGTVALTASGVDVAAGNGSILNTAVSGWELHGTYETMALDAEQAGAELYYIAANKFWHATGGIEVPPFRAYFTAPKSANNVRAFRLVTEEDTDEIQLVPTTDEDAPVYSLSGVRVPDGRSLKRGIYIVNNKKIIVK